MDKIFNALSDPSRRSMIEKLKVKEYSVLELAGHYDMTFQAVSKHLKTLERANLLTRRKEGRSYYCGYNSQPLVEAITWISKNYEFWNSNFDSLENFLDVRTSPNPK